MKLRLLVTYLLLLLASMASAQAIDSSVVLLPIYKGDKVATLDKITGWYLQNDGEWVKGKNKIPNDRTVISPKSDEFKIGKENISLLEMYLLTFDKKEYVVLAIYSEEGYYELPVLKSNWMTKKIVNYYVFDKRKLYKLLVKNSTKKPFSINLDVWCSGAVENVDRKTNIKNIAAEAIIKTKFNIIANSSNLIFSLFPASKEGEEKLYFKLTKTYTKKSIYDYYLLPKTQEKLFSRSYFEADPTDFEDFINTIISQGDPTNNKFGLKPDEVAKPWELDTAELRYNIFREQPLFEQNKKDDNIAQDTMDFYKIKDKTEIKHGSSTSFSDKKDYGKTHKIKKTTTVKSVNKRDAIYRELQTKISSDDDTIITKNKKGIVNDSLDTTEIKALKKKIKLFNDSINEVNLKEKLFEDSLNLAIKKQAILDKKNKAKIKVSNGDNKLKEIKEKNAIKDSSPKNKESLEVVKLREKMYNDSLMMVRKIDSILQYISNKTQEPIIKQSLKTFNYNDTAVIIKPDYNFIKSDTSLKVDSIKTSKLKEKIHNDSIIKIENDSLSQKKKSNNEKGKEIIDNSQNKKEIKAVTKDTAILSSSNNIVFVNTDSIEAAKVREKLFKNTNKLPDSIVQKKSNSTASISLIGKTNESGFVKVDDTKEKLKEKTKEKTKEDIKEKTKETIKNKSTKTDKEIQKEIKLKEKPYADSVKQEAKRLKKLEKQNKKEKETKVMTNYTVEPIKDTAKKDSPIIITKPKKVEEKNEILKPEIIKEKTIEDDINEFKNKEKQATSDADVNNTNPLKRNIDNRLSQGKLTCDTLAGKVFYTIQIGCLSDNFSELYFRNTFKIAQRMYLFTYGTQFKYCVGIYKKYVDAIAGLKKLLAETKLPQAYIISYVNGKLVPVSVAKTKSGESRVPFMQVAPVRK